MGFLFPTDMNLCWGLVLGDSFLLINPNRRFISELNILHKKSAGMFLPAICHEGFTILNDMAFHCAGQAGPLSLLLQERVRYQAHRL